MLHPSVGYERGELFSDGPFERTRKSILHSPVLTNPPIPLKAVASTIRDLIGVASFWGVFMDRTDGSCSSYSGNLPVGNKHGMILMSSSMFVL